MMRIQILRVSMTTCFILLSCAIGAGEEPDASDRFWAFKRPTTPPVPAVQNTAWPQSHLDHFILAPLEAAGLEPAAPADKRTLLRRTTFDLIGLPPTPAEIEAFVSDASPGAFARVVDRLLASPHYGERWGRHWLDVVRYADSNGLDENVAHGNAWRYRDYVVASLNRDKPYDSFLVEQLAGDLVERTGDAAAQQERLVATGFLSLGPKVLAEVDEKKMEMDIVDEQIDTFGRALLGLTLGCARCHEHKFDPVTMEDYYALAGIFRSTRTMETFTKVARWHENSLASETQRARQAEHEQQTAAIKKSINAVVAAATDALKRQRGDDPLPKELETLFPAETQAELKRLREKLAAQQRNTPKLPTAMGVSEGTPGDTPLLLRGSHLTPGPVVQRRFPEALSVQDQPEPSGGQSGRLELAQWLTHGEHPLTGRVMVNRIWRWHFGEGLVGSPDNFGALGRQPTNQPLLDWLAVRFVQSGWSLKAMHRLILLSSTYQMSSAYDARAARVDPENRLQWRAPIRRLEAEAIRDSMLMVSGLLDRSMGGSLLHVGNREYFFDHTSRDGTRYDAPRRSIYLPVVRNNLFEVFQLFDYSDASVPNGNRSTTTVAPQALFLLNSRFVLQVTEALAKRLTADDAMDDPGRIGRLYVNALGRPPAAHELKRALSFVEQVRSATEEEAAQERLRSWQALCQVILASNEFVYVR